MPKLLVKPRRGVVGRILTLLEFPIVLELSPDFVWGPQGVAVIVQGDQGNSSCLSPNRLGTRNGIGDLLVGLHLKVDSLRIAGAKLLVWISIQEYCRLIL